MFDNEIISCILSLALLFSFKIIDTLPDKQAIFKWIAVIFIKNQTSNQFTYHCDGALLSEFIVLTAAQCMNRTEPKSPEELLIFLGKIALEEVRKGETLNKVKKIIYHPKLFHQDAITRNDLAALVLEVPVVFDDKIQPACLVEDEKPAVEPITTTWDPVLSIANFVDNNKTCSKFYTADKTICTTYGGKFTVCPSYGGVYASKVDYMWCLRGIRTGDLADKGLCFDKTITYTDLAKHKKWVRKLVLEEKFEGF